MADTFYHVIVRRKVLESILCILQDITRYECSRSNLQANLFLGSCREMNWTWVEFDFHPHGVKHCLFLQSQYYTFKVFIYGTIRPYLCYSSNWIHICTCDTFTPRIACRACNVIMNMSKSGRFLRINQGR